MSGSPMSDSASRTGAGVFFTTHWSVVLAATDKNSPQAAAALEQLCRAYWYPLYAFVRRKGHAAPEAEDLTQEFFARLLRRDFPAGIEPGGGKFRSYLLTALQNFLTNEWERGRTKKRGSGHPPLSLHEFAAEDRYLLEPSDDATPAMLYDRQWATVLLERVRQQLREEYDADGKTQLYARLHPCLTGAERLVPYAELAMELGCSEGAVKMAVLRLRKRYGELLRQEIIQTVANPADVDDEIRSLLAAL